MGRRSRVLLRQSGARTFDSGDFPWLDHWAPPVVTGGTVYVRLGKLSAYRLPG
jgi:hypothetical protein